MPEPSPEPAQTKSVSKKSLLKGVASLGISQVALAVSLVVGLVGTLLYSVQAPSVATAMASSAMFGAAAAAAGALLGLLFGVPRTRSSGPTTPSGTETQMPITRIPPIEANTNLEQISDWLTKIIVGVTLTQLPTIKRGATGLFNGMAPALGGGPGAAAFAGAVVVYFSVLGFFAGWLYARLRLGIVMAEVLLKLSKQFDETKDKDMIQALRASAIATIPGANAIRVRSSLWTEGSPAPEGSAPSERGDQGKLRGREEPPAAKLRGREEPPAAKLRGREEPPAAKLPAEEDEGGPDT